MGPFAVMVRILRDADLRDLVDVPQAVACMERGYRADASGGVIPFPRSRFDARDVSLAWLGAAIPSEGVLGFRTYLHGADGGDRGEQVVTLYGHPDMRVRAVFLGRLVANLRTGAALAAALHLTEPDAREIGLIGTGAQARNALACTSTISHPSRVLVWSPHREHVEEFRDWSYRALNLRVEIAASAAEVVRSVPVVVFATAAERVILTPGEMTSPRLLLSISAYRRPELDYRILAAAPRIWTDSVAQAGGPGTLLDTVEGRRKLQPLGQGILEGTARDRSSTRIVVNTGAAWEEVLLSKVLLESAESHDRGTVLPMPDEPQGASVF